MLCDRPRAEEIIHNAFVQLLNWPEISRCERPDPWVRRVAVRVAMPAIRRDRLLTAIRPRLFDPLAATADRLDVTAAVVRLPGSQCAAIALH